MILLRKRSVTIKVLQFQGRKERMRESRTKKKKGMISGRIPRTKQLGVVIGLQEIERTTIAMVRQQSG